MHFRRRTLNPNAPFFRARVFVAIVACLLFAASLSLGQTVVADGLIGPIKISSVEAGTLLVSEVGTGPNTGRLARVDTDSGAVHPLLDGLPSGFDSTGAPAGPTDMVPLNASRVLLLIGEGDVVRNAEAPGVQMPNPEGWSSPILSSILDLRFSHPIASISETFSLSIEDHFTLANGNKCRVFVSGEWVTIKLLEDFRDLVPDAVTRVRASNTFGMAATRRNTLLVVDSGQNHLTVTQRHKGTTRRLASFEPIDNALPFGPPKVDAVPTSVRFHHPNGLLVSLFSGFPFAPGSSSIVAVDLFTGETSPYITGLTTAIDVLPLPRSGRSEGTLVLEFSGNLLAEPPEPGRLLYYEDPLGTPDVLAPGLLTPTSMAYESVTGRIFVSELATGHILAIERP